MQSTLPATSPTRGRAIGCIFLMGLASIGCASRNRPDGLRSGSGPGVNDTRRIAAAITDEPALAGWVVGVRPDRIGPEHAEPVRRAAEKARDNPARVADVSGRLPGATPTPTNPVATADLNVDGVVTVDEVIALSDAGLSDNRIIARLRGSGCVFELTSTQRTALLANGLSARVIAALSDVSGTARLAADRSDPAAP